LPDATLKVPQIFSRFTSCARKELWSELNPENLGEVTVSRFLRESLGERPDFVRIFEWNFDTQPYFLESEYAGPNLAEWADSQGGLAGMPLENRSRDGSSKDALPKSASLICPPASAPGVTSTLAGFKSFCSTPAPWATATVSAIPTTIRTVC
jgi:hypothetical protein